MFFEKFKPSEVLPFKGIIFHGYKILLILSVIPKFKKLSTQKVTLISFFKKLNTRNLWERTKDNMALREKCTYWEFF